MKQSGLSQLRSNSYRSEKNWQLAVGRSSTCKEEVDTANNAVTLTLTHSLPLTHILRHTHTHTHNRASKFLLLGNLIVGVSFFCCLFFGKAWDWLQNVGTPMHAMGWECHNSIGNQITFDWRSKALIVYATDDLNGKINCWQLIKYFNVKKEHIKYTRQVSKRGILNYHMTLKTELNWTICGRPNKFCSQWFKHHDCTLQHNLHWV